MESTFMNEQANETAWTAGTTTIFKGDDAITFYDPCWGRTAPYQVPCPSCGACPTCGSRTRPYYSPLVIW